MPSCWRAAPVGASRRTRRSSRRPSFRSARSTRSSRWCSASCRRRGSATSRWPSATSARSSRAYCADGLQWNLKIDYWWEDEPLGTMGPIVAHLDDVPENFLVINGDVLTDLDCRKFLLEHAQSDAPISVATSERTIALDFGLVELGGERDRSIVAFQEKPVRNITVSTGIYAVLARDAPPLRARHATRIRRARARSHRTARVPPGGSVRRALARRRRDRRVSARQRGLG